MGTTIITRHISAPAARVYQALTDPALLARWQVPDGMTSHIHSFDACEGGAFRISLTYQAPGPIGKTSAHTDTYSGHFVALIPDRCVIETMAFETEDEAMRGEMRIRFDLSEADGGTLLHAVHEGVPPGVSLDDNETGWRMAVDKLCALLEQTPGATA